MENLIYLGVQMILEDDGTIHSATEGLEQFSCKIFCWEDWNLAQASHLVVVLDTSMHSVLWSQLEHRDVWCPCQGLEGKISKLTNNFFFMFSW